MSDKIKVKGICGKTTGFALIIMLADRIWMKKLNLVISHPQNKKEALARELLFYFVDKSTEKKMRKEKYKKKAN